MSNAKETRVRPIEYTPGDFEELLSVAQGRRVLSLCHRPFVDYYYSENPWCKLYLAKSQTGSILGTIGIDQMRFACGQEFHTFGFATNYHAIQTGVGGYLYLFWMKSCPFGLVFGGSADTHRILKQQRWTYFPGVKTYVLNRQYHILPDEPTWKRLAKLILAQVPRVRVADRVSRLPQSIRQHVCVVEEQRITDDMLPASSPFLCRFAPTTEYLNWRYRTDLSFVRYRVFRVCAGGKSSGYVVLNESPNSVMVAQCDGDDASALAYGVLMSLAQVMAGDRSPREVVLTCSHHQMGHIYRQFGFRAQREERPLVVGSRKGAVDLPSDTSHWLVNLDWGDNGLRAPFLDQHLTVEDDRVRSRDIFRSPSPNEAASPSV